MARRFWRDSAQRRSVLSPLIRVCLDPDVGANAVQPLLQELEHVGIDSGRPRFDDGRKRSNAARVEGIGQRGDPFPVLLVTRQEEVVVVKDEDVDAARPLQIDHLVGDVLDATQPVAPAGQALLVPGGKQQNEQLA